MLNKKAQVGDWEEIIKFILVAPILIALIGAIITIVNQPDCPQCEDCSIYKNNLSNLSGQLEICKNQSKE